jgi:hypothetical protein
MGIATAHAVRRGTLTVALMAAAALLIMLAVMAVGASLATQDAQALTTFDTAAGAIPACETCHAKTDTHSKPAHVNGGIYDPANSASCANCHPNGDTAVKPLPSKCAVCHGGVTVILSKATHTATGCGTTVGCHGFSSPPPGSVVATTVNAKVAPTTIKLGKTVKTTGAVTPVATLAGKKVTFRVDIKQGAKWVKVKVKSATATVTPTGTYSWKYKPAKKGTFHVTASIAATATYKSSKSKAMTFKVK